MRRLSTTKPYTCVTCEVEIVGPATFHVGLPFCCSGCVAGGPCTCSYDAEPDVAGEGAGVRHCLDVAGALADHPPAPVGGSRHR
jgi:hypothetical protein